MRRPLVAANWKMNLRLPEAVKLAEDLRRELTDHSPSEVAVFPTFVSLAAVAQVLEGSAIRVGAQDCARWDDGPYTGEVSAAILRSSGARMVILGHSERRQLLGETDQIVREKLERALAHGLEPIVCLGETRPERHQGLTLEVVERQLGAVLSGLSPDALLRLTFAYEPVWAIGTGLVATPEQAQEVHSHIRSLLREAAGAPGDDRRILYGGSVKAENIAGLMAMPDIDGALVGGASLKLHEFRRIASLGRN